MRAKIKGFSQPRARRQCVDEDPARGSSVVGSKTGEPAAIAERALCSTLVPPTTIGAQFRWALSTSCTTSRDSNFRIAVLVPLRVLYAAGRIGEPRILVSRLQLHKSRVLSHTMLVLQVPAVGCPEPAALLAPTVDIFARH